MKFSKQKIKAEIRAMRALLSKQEEERREFLKQNKEFVKAYKTCWGYDDYVFWEEPFNKESWLIEDMQNRGVEFYD